jgi:DNA-binding XRE family transcriptional regulator
MARNFRELEAKLPPKRRAKIKARTQKMAADMLLSEMRKKAGMTQQAVAKELGMRQPGVARLEAQDDIQVSTLRRLVAALGGKLEIIAHLPTGDVRLAQFGE